MIEILKIVASILICFAPFSEHSETVRERLDRDPSFRFYSVIFGVTLNSNSSLNTIRVSKVIEPKTQSTDAVDVKVPEQYIAAARTLIEKKKYSAKLKDGKPVEFFTYFFYTPERPDKVIVDMDKPLGPE